MIRLNCIKMARRSAAGRLDNLSDIGSFGTSYLLMLTVKSSSGEMFTTLDTLHASRV